MNRKIFRGHSCFLIAAAICSIMDSGRAWSTPITTGAVNPPTIVNGDNGPYVNVGETPAFTPGVGTLQIGPGDDVSVSGIDNQFNAGFGTQRNGTIVVSGGGKLRASDLRGGDSGSSGTGGAVGKITVTGPGSEIIVSSDQGLFSDPPNEAGFVRFGRLSGATGSDSGTLEVLNGGRLQVSSGETVNTTTSGPQLQFGRGEGSIGTGLVDGSGSIVDIFQSAPADADNGGPSIIVGRAGTGSLTIRNSGSVQLTGDDAFVAVGQGDVTASSNLPQSELQILSGGRLTITGNPTGDSAGVTVARRENGNGAILVSGPGSELQIAGNGGAGNSPGMTVGHSGVGSLTVADGGLVAVNSGGAEFGGMSIGGNFLTGPDSATGKGDVTVTGLGSELDVLGGSSVIEVGAFGKGSLSLIDGGRAQTQDMFIGGEDGGNGKLEVGSGSQLTLQGVDTFGGAAAFLQVGDAGHGEADVDGGRILIDGAGGTSPGLIVGGEELAAGSGQVSVSNGGEIDITGNQSFLAVGRNGNGTLDLTGGSKVVLDNSDGKAAGFVGVSPTSIGTVVVDGANSLLDSGNRLNIGFDLDLNPGGTGTVSVRNGGVIKATETHVGLNGFLGGNGQVAGSVFNDGGTVAPGLSPGTLTVAVDYTQTAGLLEIQIGGLAPGQFDVLNVSGDANFLGGSILFSFVDGFLPQTGDLVDFLVANSISGLENADFLFKGVAPGFQLDVQNTGSALRFVAESNAAAVPEPTTLAVVVTGLIGLLVVRRRRRSQNPYPREVSC